MLLSAAVVGCCCAFFVLMRGDATSGKETLFILQFLTRAFPESYWSMRFFTYQNGKTL